MEKCTRYDSFTNDYDKQDEKNSGVSFNTTLGIASCLGSMPIGLDGNLTGIQVWIGMDVFSEGKKHIAASTVPQCYWYA